MPGKTRSRFPVSRSSWLTVPKSRNTERIPI
jgi:hypothetical protein